MQHLLDSNHLASNVSFVRLLEGYRASGGMAPRDVVARLLEEDRLGDFVSLEKLLGNQQVFAVEWCHSMWIPMFQFHSRELSIKLAVQVVRAELPRDALGWSVGTWFAWPNHELDGQRPADLIDSQLVAVIETARRYSLSSLVHYGQFSNQ